MNNAAALALYERVGWSIALTGLRGGANVIIGILIARLLGPELFGLYSFLVVTFLSGRQLIDLGVSNAFFTFSSENFPSRKQVIFFALFLILSSAASILIFTVFISDSFLTKIFTLEDRLVLFIGMASVFFQHHLWVNVANFAEVLRMTKVAQIIQTATAVTSLAAIYFIDFVVPITLLSIFIIIGMCWCCGTLALLIMTSNRTVEERRKSTGLRADMSLSRFARYCYPMLPYVVIMAVATFFDRWIIQNFYDSSEQAYFGLAWQIAAISSLLVTAILRIYWRESAELVGKGRLTDLHGFHLKFTRTAVFVSSVIAASLIPWSEWLVLLVYGEVYARATVSLTIIIAYTAFQGLSQLQGALLMSASATGAYSGIVIGITVLGGLLSCTLMVLNQKLGEAGLGAAALAVKFFIMQFLQIIVMSVFISKKFKWPVDWNILFFSPVLLLSYALLVKEVVVSIEIHPFLSLIFFVGLMIIPVFCMMIFYPKKSIGFESFPDG